MELVLLNQITWCQLKQKHRQGKETDFNTFMANTPELLKRSAVRTRDVKQDHRELTRYLKKKFDCKIVW